MTMTDDNDEAFLNYYVTNDMACVDHHPLVKIIFFGGYCFRLEKMLLSSFKHFQSLIYIDILESSAIFKWQFASNRLADVELFSTFITFFPFPIVNGFPPPRVLVIFSLHHDGRFFFLVFVTFFGPSLRSKWGWCGWSRRLLYFHFYLSIYSSLFLSHSPRWHDEFDDPTSSCYPISNPSPFLSRLTSLLYMFAFCPDLLMRTWWTKIYPVHHV